MAGFFSFFNQILFFSLYWWKTANILQEKSCLHVGDDNIGYFCKKREGVDWQELKFCTHVDKTFSWRKKTVFYHLRPSLWKCNLKYLDICLQSWMNSNICVGCFWKHDQLVPKSFCFQIKRSHIKSKSSHDNE